MKSLAIVVGISLASWVLAAASLIHANSEAKQERRALTTFVCASVTLAAEFPSPEGQRRAEVYGEILDSIGESCD